MSRNTRTDVFSTGEIASMCGVAPRTVQKWVDAGLLPGYRLPGSNDRRVLRETVVRFLRDNSLPIPAKLTSIRSLLFVTNAAGFADRLACALSEWKVERVSDMFSAGLLCGRGGISAVLLDLSLDRSNCLRLAQSLADSKIVRYAIAYEDDAEVAAMPFFDAVFWWPCSVAAIVDGIGGA